MTIIIAYTNIAANVILFSSINGLWPGLEGAFWSGFFNRGAGGSLEKISFVPAPFHNKKNQKKDLFQNTKNKVSKKW